MGKNKNGIPSVQDLLIIAPLYSKYDISKLPEEIIRGMIYFQEPGVKAYCVECKQMSIFRNKANVPLIAGTYAHCGVIPSDVPLEFFTQNVEENYHKNESFKIELSCARVPAHLIHFFFFVRENKLIKVGQYPSLADFQLPSLDKYNHILTEDERQEFAKAIGLCAHGIGIGSFVYLRRIFEKLIEKANKKARCKEPNWDEGVYEKSRMDEKITMLKDYLPELLVKNAGIYSVLSVGIHSLSESECLKYFDTVKQGIELILDEEIERQEKEKRAKNLTNEIAKIKGEYKIKQ